MRLALKLTKIDYSSIKFKCYLQICTTSGKKLLILYTKQPMKDHRQPAHNENSLELTPKCLRAQSVPLHAHIYLFQLDTFNFS